MLSVLARHYPSYRMDEVCRHCRGNPKRSIDKYRCGVCGKTHQDYKDANLEHEVEEWNYLHQTWLKVKRFRQMTTGIASLDNVLERIFGKPHDGDWRNYKKWEELTEKKVRNVTMLRGVAV